MTECSKTQIRLTGLIFKLKMKSMQEKGSLMFVGCRLKILSLWITVQHQSASWIVVPTDGIFSLHLTTVKDSYIEVALWKSIELTTFYYNWKIMSCRMTKPAEWSVHQAKTQISLSICPVWSEPSQCTQSHVSSRGQRRLWSDLADAQADLILRWAHRSFGWLCHAAALIGRIRTLEQMAVIILKL